MQATLKDHMGSDLTVVNAARVSFAKESSWEEHDEELLLGRQGTKLSNADRRLINYLARHNHWSPFSHPQVQFHIKAPIFVARQLGKHVVGFSWNEVSRRYVDAEPEFYHVNEWRKRAENKKQGSTLEAIAPNDYYQEYQHRIHEFCLQAYQQMLADNICPEQARTILPQSMYTEWYWTGSLYGWARMCNLRLKEDTQFETRLIAQQISVELAKLFPESWKVLVDA